MDDTHIYIYIMIMHKNGKVPLYIYIYIYFQCHTFCIYYNTYIYNIYIYISVSYTLPTVMNKRAARAMKIHSAII